MVRCLLRYHIWGRSVGVLSSRSRRRLATCTAGEGEGECAHVWDSEYQASADAPGRAATQDGKADGSVDLVRSPSCYSTVG
jgi:hypothetical protein